MPLNDQTQSVHDAESVRAIMEERGFQNILANINTVIGTALSEGVARGSIESALIHAAVKLRTEGKQTLSADDIGKIGQFLTYHCFLFTKHLIGGSKDYPIIDEIIAETQFKQD